jgi:alpha-tubulin suppressor-like RCC1 family protein/tetratricopeptide (TPR) repeat protein
MAVLKCKMCGGDIQVTDAAYGTCESCGATSTLPKSNDEKIVNLFNRANHFRRLNEFDKALTTYENILNEDNTNAEAHWCVVLSRYGIEYVEDPVSHERIPTCNRVQYEPILSDPDYLAALEFASDDYSKSLYEEEAKKISDIQKGILAISGNEAPYDVFICYKETTDGGSRTVDSTIAQDIYYQLTNDGYRVFFSKITLEDKLGHEYEPYIFSALNSAKVMLVVGTKKEHFEAVWVKNEWSRFLAIMKKNRSRLLIPCYKDMDAYDLPDELSSLQSQDMSKIGFIQDIIRGIKKVLDASKGGGETSGVVGVGIVPGNTDGADVSKAVLAQQMEQSLKRGFLFLEDGEWSSAESHFNSVLAMDAKSAPAYVGLLCVDLKVREEESLAKYSQSPIDGHTHYKKAMRCADEAYRAKLEEYSDENKQSIAEKKRLDAEINKREAEKNEEKKKRDAEKKSAFAEKRKKFIQFQDCISAAAFHTVGLKTDGTVVSVGSTGRGECNTKYWGDIIAISTGHQKTVGLRADGIVLASGDKFRDSEIWRDVIAISIGDEHIVGLKADGTVVAVGKISDARCKTGDWQNITAISAGKDHTVGLKSDGTVVSVGKNDNNQCNTNNWRDIIAISAGEAHTIGLKKNGTVVAAWDKDSLDSKEWQDIVAITARRHYAMGLRADGTVVVSGGKGRDTESWRDIVAISEGLNHTAGLRADGTVVATGANDTGQCNTESWRDIVAIAAGSNHTVGLKSDGTVITIGKNDSGQCNTEEWQNIGPVDKEQCLQQMLEGKRHWKDVEEQRIKEERREREKRKKDKKIRLIVSIPLLPLAALSYGLGFMLRLKGIPYNEILIIAAPIFAIVFYLLRKRKTS